MARFPMPCEVNALQHANGKVRGLCMSEGSNRAVHFFVHVGLALENAHMHKI